MQITIPPFLKKGDTIGMVCPAGYMPIEKAATCIKVLQQWGYKVLVGKTVGHQHHYFSGTDEERLTDLQAMLDNPSVNAILCGRGGYGTSRIIDQVNWRGFRKHPKWIIGFSDITVLHCYLLQKRKVASLHAPMAGAFNDEGYLTPYVQSLRKMLAGQKSRHAIAAHPLNRLGKTSGLLAGGNLSLIAHQLGTPSALDTRGKILFLEDVGEYLYNIDRILVQLDRAGKLKALAGLVVGGFTDSKDTTIPFGQSAEEIIAARVAPYGYPVCFGFPVSHERENMSLMVGGQYTLEVGSRQAVLKQG